MWTLVSFTGHQVATSYQACLCTCLSHWRTSVIPLTSDSIVGAHTSATVHSGCAFSGLVWLCVFTGQATRELLNKGKVRWFGHCKLTRNSHNLRFRHRRPRLQSLISFLCSLLVLCSSLIRKLVAPIMTLSSGPIASLVGQPLLLFGVR